MVIKLEKVNKGTIINWRLNSDDPKCPMILGLLHMSHDEYQFVHTSRVLKIDFETMTVETLNSFYTLGERVRIMEY